MTRKRINMDVLDVPEKRSDSSNREAAVAEIRRAFEERDERARAAQAPKKKPKTSTRRRAEAGTRISFYVPHELEEAVRLRAAQEGRSLSNLGEKAFRLYLESSVSKEP